MHATEDGDDLGVDLLDDLKQALGLVDGGRDGRAADDVGAIGDDGGAHLLLRQIVGHGVDEAHLRVARGLERTGEIGHPRRRPIAGDLGAARVVVWVNEENAHASSPGLW